MSTTLQNKKFSKNISRWTWSDANFSRCHSTHPSNGLLFHGTLGILGWILSSRQIPQTRACIGKTTWTCDTYDPSLETLESLLADKTTLLVPTHLSWVALGGKRTYWGHTVTYGYIWGHMKRKIHGWPQAKPDYKLDLQALPHEV